MTPDQIAAAIRIGWTLEFLVFSVVAAYNLKEALIDYWARTQQPEDGHVEALVHETRGSAFVQLFAFLALVSGFLGGLSALLSISFGGGLAIIALGQFLGALTIFEAVRRVKVAWALRASRRPREPV